MPYQAITLERARNLLRSRTDSSVFWTDEEARLALNEALREWNLLTGRWKTRLTVTVPAQTARVPLPDAFTFGARVLRTDGQALDPTSLVELDLGLPAWRQQTTSDGGTVPTSPRLWAPESLTTIVLWPHLQAAGSLVVDGIAATPLLDTDASWVDLGAEHVTPILGMALHLLTFKEGGPRFRATRPLWVAFLQAACQENTRLKGQQVFRRLAGLDRRRDLQPLRVDGTRLDDQVQRAAGAQGRG